ncbi:MAG TPA: NAD(+) synthase [Treponema sp.]|nr:NAD(+) synthase [Treponema sp.]
MDHGFFRVAAASPVCTVGDCGTNTAEILTLINKAVSLNANLVVFPELAITAYTCGDLFSQELLGRVALAAVRLIAEKTRDLPITIVVGFPFSRTNTRYNCAAVISGGLVRGIVPKTRIPNYGEFYELRHFSPAPENTQILPAGMFGPAPVPFGTKLLFSDLRTSELSFAVEICEDLWAPAPPSASHVEAGALIIANLSATNEVVGKADYRRALVTGQSGQGVCAYVYADAGLGESTGDMVFSGHSIIAENGSIVAENPPFSGNLLCTDIDIRRLLHERRRLNTFPSAHPEAGDSPYTIVSFTMDHVAAVAGTSTQTEQHPADQLANEKQAKTLLRHIDPHPFVPSSQKILAQRCEEILAIQTAGLVKRLRHVGTSTAIIGLSGGLDSTLALLVIVRAFDQLELPRTNILTISMPGFGTTTRTKGNAKKLSAALGTTLEEIRINKAVTQHFKDIGQDSKTHDVTYENAQARERTQILMDKANMLRGLVIGTGDLSELALGWTTYNGDHMSMYAVNTSVPKTLVRSLVAHCAELPLSFIQNIESTTEKPVTEKQLTGVLTSILDTPVSPELLPAKNNEIQQKTEDIVGPYELHDFFLYHLLRWGSSPAKILFIAEHAFGTLTPEPKYTREEIISWMQVFYRRFFSQQFKRSCMPDGPKIGSVNLSPRGDWRMPSDASAAVWLKELESLE